MKKIAEIINECITQPGLSTLGIVLWSIAILLLALFVILKLNKVFKKWFFYLFEQEKNPDKEIGKKISRFACELAFMVPCVAFSTILGVLIIQRNGQFEFHGISFGFKTKILVLLLQYLYISCGIRILAFFSKCYAQRKDTSRRPIRPVIILLHVLLILWGFLWLFSFIVQERPIVLLSSFGAVAALFLFAFQNMISSMIANIRINAEKIFDVGDWVVIEGHNIDGIVESITTHTVKVRNWDMSLVSFPLHRMMEETLINYEAMIRSGARMIKRAILLDQRSIRFLTQEEIKALKELGLVSDEMLKHADTFDETDKLSGSHLWTNVELFNLYAEDYLRRRPDIRHDMRCLVRSLAPDSSGLPLELFCYATKPSLTDFEPIQRSIIYHLLAVLPSFRLRVFQDCSDIYQEVGNVPDYIGSAFRYDKFKNPVYPVNN